jgi:hypothetical protein
MRNGSGAFIFPNVIVMLLPLRGQAAELRIGSMDMIARACSLSCVLACLTGPVRAQARLPELTTDTWEYCESLHDRLAGVTAQVTHPLPREVVDLSAKGYQMCQEGHVRGGIQRLRRALVIMQQRLEAP